MKFTLFFTTLLLVGCNTYLGRDIPGPKGEVGPVGAPGTSCFVSQTPSGAAIACSDGSSAPISNGANGSNGTNGTDGSDATIGIVQFCSGSTSYPTTFVEVGFCINNELWAVYSENNGFLVKVPPGVYQSHGHNSSCAFIVAPNCQITY